MPTRILEPGGTVSDLLESGLSEIGLTAEPGQLEALAGFTGRVAEWGGRLNLSGHRQPDSIVRRLVLGAAALCNRLPDLASLNDLGSGAGFPGVPIAILRPKCAVHLVEARERRYHFLRDAARRLDLSNLTVERGRIEAVEAKPAAGAVAQAVGPVDRVLEWMLPWVEPRGWLVLPASLESDLPTARPDIVEAEVRDYRVPLGGPPQRLWLARKGRISGDA